MDLFWRHFATALCFLAFSSPAASSSRPEKPPAASKQKADFARDILPIFTDRCLQCHGAERQKNGFRLDRKVDALKGGDSGPSILPGKSAESRLIQFVAGLDPETVMPPKGARLTSAEVGLLRRWIDQGAPWPDNLAVLTNTGKAHWAFQKPARPVEPSVRNRSWARNPIDLFVLKRLEEEKLKPSPEADRYTLIRRLNLDLTGLPPSVDEAEAFAHDKSSAAYEKLVDRLLASPHFGEQWARHWLDLARYADSDGYEKDFYRPHAWRWRNWVIDSINRDQPFDEFTRDQLAGDLIPGATVEQRLATGFHRNTLLNREGGVDIEEDRVKAVVDRVSTVSTAWLGLTIGCAECHNHKYDPITQREFYQLYAFFNSTDDRDIKAPLPAESDRVGKEIDALTQAKRSYVRGAETNADFAAWTARVAALPDIWSVPAQADYELPTFGANNGANLYPQEDGSFLVTGMVENKTHYIMMLNTRLKGITGIRVEAMTDEMLPRLGPGWASNGNFVLSELRVESSPLADVNRLTADPVLNATADYSQKDWEIQKTIDGDEKTGWAVDMPHLAMHAVDRCAVFVLKGDVGYDGGTRLKVNLVQHHGSSHTLGRLRVSYTTADRSLLEAQAVPQRIREVARIPAGDRTLDQQVTLKRYYQATFDSQSPELIAYSRAMADSPGVKGEIQGQTLAERQHRRETHVHVRGNFLDLGEAVEPGTPKILHPVHSRFERIAQTAAAGAGWKPPDRLDLAQWLMDPENPLTARVVINQIWFQLFGNGLVTTIGDFGSQGERPTHPELLDWLATEMVRQHWSRKAMIKLMVMSSSYRQQSVVREDLVRSDPLNKWLGRQNRFRLTAENARDQYLAASRLLDATIGGPSVTPASRRRGLYLQYKRAFPEYMLATFDEPNSTQSCPKRERSNTPLQALTLMNDTVFMNCARSLGASLAESSEPTRSRLARAFQSCVARPPTEVERGALLELFQKLQRVYQADSNAAHQVVGERKVSPEREAETAAWMVLARSILNLDEVIMRE